LRGVNGHNPLVAQWGNAMDACFSVVNSISVNPEILGGTPVFLGTRVPVRILFEYIESGDNLGEFLEEFPSVSKELAIAALEQAYVSVINHAHPSR
jgi:uncharacterized protein (DUF433 family)